MSVHGVRFVVAGRVQGVFYRAATSETAQRLGLGGWVRNLADGRVEVVVSGDPAAIEKLAAWLWNGPPAAVVTAVHMESWEGALPPGFVVQA